MQDLDTVEPLPARLERHAFDRLIMLSDGVFAIAITLAALELKPRGEWRTTAELWDGLKLPLFAYFVSFAVTAAYWSAHRDTFARLRKVDAPASLLTLALLFFVALLPATTQLLYEGGRAEALRIYAWSVCGTGLAQAMLWAYAAFASDLMSPEVTRGYRLARLSFALLIPAFFAFVALRGSMAVNGDFALASLAVVAALAVLRRVVLPRLGDGRARRP